MLIVLIIGGAMVLVAAGILLTNFGLEEPLEESLEESTEESAQHPPARRASNAIGFDRHGSKPISLHRATSRPSSPAVEAPDEFSLGHETSGWPLYAVAEPLDLGEHTVSVIIPTLNEVGSLAWVLEQLPSWVSEVVLVDGLSTDGTEILAREVRPDVVVVHQLQPGKGAALRAGFAAATGDIVVMIDADGSTDPREMPRFVGALVAGADFVKGSRHMETGGSADFTRIRSAGNRGFVTLANLLYGSEFTDLCYGYCAFWRHHLEALALDADGFEIETQLVLNAVRAGLRIEEVPSFELARRAGTSNLHAFRDGRRVLRTLLSERARAQPGVSTANAGIDLVEHVVPTGLVYQAVPGVRRELAA